MYITKKLKSVKLKKKKSSLVFFLKKKRYYFIKFKYRVSIWRRKRWKIKKNSKIHISLLNQLFQKIRFNINNFVFQNIKKKRLLSLINVKESNNNYNLNLIPFNELSNIKKKFIFKNLNLLKNKFFPKIFMFFSSNFFEKLTQQKVFFKLVTNIKLSFFEHIWVKYFFRKFFFLQKQFRGVLHLNELIYLLLLTFQNKDLFFLKNWLINFLEKIGLKKHKTFLRGFKRIVLTILNTSSKFLKIKGFYFDIRGKVGVAGNAKKRHTAIKYKQYGFTNIKLKADQLKFNVRTNTGVLGVTTIITY